jgi:hypothetical protein
MPGRAPVTITVAASALGGKQNAATATLFLRLPAMLLLAGSFLLPLIRLIGLSLSSPAGRLAPYVELIGNDVYRRCSSTPSPSRSW